MIDKLTNYASIIGVIGAIGGGFYAWGEFNTRLDGIENKEFVVNETVDLAPVNEKISDLEVEILDRMSALEDEWMARDNDSNDDILNDIAGLKSDVEDLFDKASAADKQLQLNIVELSDKTFKDLELTDESRTMFENIYKNHSLIPTLRRNYFNETGTAKIKFTENQTKRFKLISCIKQLAVKDLVSSSVKREIAQEFTKEYEVVKEEELENSHDKT